MYRRKILIAIFAAFIPNLAFAQNPQLLDLFHTIDKNAPTPEKSIIITEVMKAAVTIQKQTGVCVASSAEIEKIAPATGDRYIIEGAVTGRLKNGWTVYAKHPNCGTDVSRYLIMQAIDGSFETIRLNKGRSNANAKLIDDSLVSIYTFASLAISKVNKKCNSKHILSATLGTTRIVNEESNLGPELYGVRFAGSWNEIWPVIICGQTAEVPVRFTADGDGGAYINMKSDEVKVLPVTQ